MTQTCILSRDPRIYVGEERNVFEIVEIGLLGAWLFFCAAGSVKGYSRRRFF